MTTGLDKIYRTYDLAVWKFVGSVQGCKNSPLPPEQTLAMIYKYLEPVEAAEAAYKAAVNAPPAPEIEDELTARVGVEG